MTTDALRVEQRDAVRWLLLNRPASRNALNEEIAAALEEQVDDVERDPSTAVVVLAGEGPSFSAGGDFRHFLAIAGSDGVVPFLTGLSACIARIDASSKPWVAALHGHAIAGGLELALACDVVIAAKGTLIGDGHLANRLLPGAGSAVRLERAVGKGAARWMHLSGETVAAEDLVGSGWIREIVPPEALRDHAHLLAERLATRHPVAQQNMKRLLHAVRTMGDDEALAQELRAFELNWTQSEVPAALEDFLDRRRAAPVRKS